MSVLSKVMQKIKKDFNHARINFFGYEFETGVPVSFAYLHKPGASKGYTGDKSRFQQDIEPAGKYVILDEINDEKKTPEGYKRGEVTLNNPLVLKWGDRYDHTSWKQNLVDVYGKKGKELTEKLKKDGYDGIVTVDAKSVSEIVILK